MHAKLSAQPSQAPRNVHSVRSSYDSSRDLLDLYFHNNPDKAPSVITVDREMLLAIKVAFLAMPAVRPVTLEDVPERIWHLPADADAEQVAGYHLTSVETAQSWLDYVADNPRDPA